MPRFKVMITDCKFNNFDYEKKIFQDINAELIIAQCKTTNEIISLAPKDLNGLLVQYVPISREVIEYLPQLKVIGCYGIGVDMVDLKAATEHGIYVVNVPDYCIEEVSNHTFALIMALQRKIVEFNEMVKKQYIWDFNVLRPIYCLQGKTLGIIGFGKIPQNLIKKVIEFGLKVLVSDPFIDKSFEKEYPIKIIGLRQLLMKSDYISIHTPLNENTKHMISYNEFKLMKNSAYIINTARGPIIDENALIDALLNKKIAGAALDVTETEPIEKTNPLLKMSNVIITPHIAFYSEESLKKLQTKAAQNVADILLGKEPINLVNKLN